MTRIGGIAILSLALGFAIWSAGFVLLYALLSIGCELGWQDARLFAGLSVQRAVLLTALAGVLLAHALAWAATARLQAAAEGEGDRFLLGAARRLAVLSGLASAITFAGTPLLTTCS